MLRVVAVVAARALVFEHHRVVNQPCNAHRDLLARDRTGHPVLDTSDPNSAPFQGLAETFNIWNDLDGLKRLPQTTGASVPT